MKWKPYPKYKESGVEWLGAVPEHWSIVRLKRVAGLQSGLTLGKDYGDKKLERRPYLRVANVQDGFLDLTTITEIDVPGGDLGRHELRYGDVLMTEGGDFDKLGRGFVWYAQIPGCLHQNHIFAMRPKAQTLNPMFLARLMTSSHGKAYFTSTSQQTTNLASTNSTKILNFPIPLPPYSEQIEIVEALEQQTATTDELGQKAETAISLLRERRAALISHAVTKGLNPDAPMKPSGVEWLGNVPAHWKVMTLKNFSTLQRGHDLTDAERTEGPYPVVTSGGISGTHGSFMAHGPGVVTGRYGSTGRLFYIESNFGSPQEFVRSGILRGFPDFLKSDVFSVGHSHALPAGALQEIRAHAAWASRGDSELDQVPCVQWRRRGNEQQDQIHQPSLVRVPNR